MRYYEDLRESEERVSAARTVDAQEMIEFARRYDPMYLHVDPESAQRSIFGGVIASGLYTITLWRQLDYEMAHDIAWICGLAWDKVRFPIAVRAGDTLRACAKCLSKRPSKKRPERGVVVFEYRLVNQRDETVFSFHSTSLIERRPRAGQGAVKNTSTSGVHSP